MIFASYAGRDRINGTVRVLDKTRLIFSRINGPIVYNFKLSARLKLMYFLVVNIRLRRPVMVITEFNIRVLN